MWGSIFISISFLFYITHVWLSSSFEAINWLFGCFRDLQVVSWCAHSHTVAVAWRGPQHAWQINNHNKCCQPCYAPVKKWFYSFTKEMVASPSTLTNFTAWNTTLCHSCNSLYSCTPVSLFYSFHKTPTWLCFPCHFFGVTLFFSFPRCLFNTVTDSVH